MKNLILYFLLAITFIPAFSQTWEGDDTDTLFVENDEVAIITSDTIIPVVIYNLWFNFETGKTDTLGYLEVSMRSMSVERVLINWDDPVEAAQWNSMGITRKKYWSRYYITTFEGDTLVFLEPTVILLR